MTPIISGYVLETIVGCGSHAQVWSARRVSTGERVAIKWLPGTTAHDDDSARAECALLAGLDHPNLIALREFVVGDTGCALVMEYAGGGSLAALLRSRRRLTPPEVVAGLSPIAAALAHAHDNGVVHGDISTANILFDADGRPKLADLGVARLAALRDRRRDIVGTPAYLDPVIAAGSPAVAASDVFSLGAVALHALTGLGPWEHDRNDSVETVLRRSAEAETRDLRAALADSPPAVAALVRRALEVQPYRRGSAAEFALDLRASIAPRPVTLGAGRLPRNAGRHASEAAGDLDDPLSTGFVGIALDLTRLVGRKPEPANDTAPGRRSVRRRGLVICSITMGSVLCAAALVFGVPAVRAKSGPSHDSAASPPPASSQIPTGTSTAPTGRSTAPAEALRAHAASRSASAGSSSTAAASRSTSAGSSSTAAASRSASAAHNAPTVPATDQLGTSAALGALRRLDVDRSTAYAARQPQLLDKVYDSADLLAADQRRLLDIVPAGCGLHGLSTVYSALRVLSSGAGIVRLSVGVRMESAQLTCPDRPPMRVLPAPPVTMHLMLRQGAEGLRIAVANRVSG